MESGGPEPRAAASDAASMARTHPLTGASTGAGWWRRGADLHMWIYVGLYVWMYESVDVRLYRAQSTGNSWSQAGWDCERSIITKR